jgi:hypothetical protein
MAGFHTKTFYKHDDYMTPKSAWENIKHIIPKEKVIWEAFYGDGKSGDYLRELGFNVIHEQIDFFKNDKGDIIVSNPPFSKSKEILHRLKELNKPFILILPCSKLTTQYMRKLFLGDNDFKIIIPKKRIHFSKLIEGLPVWKEGKSSCNFDCFYYCWKIELPNSIIWLDN